MENDKYSWKQMSYDYTASYYNDEDYKRGKKFIIIDNSTGKKYEYPQIEIRTNDKGMKYKQIVIDNDLWNEEFIKWAICSTKDFINHVGEDWLTPEVLNYISSHYEFPQLFDSKLKNYMTKELWDSAFQRNYKVIRYIPAEYQTQEYQKTVVDNAPESIYLIDPDVITEETIYYALSKKGSVLRFVPKERRTQKVCEYAVNNSGEALRYVPRDIKSNKLCFKAVVKDPNSIKYVPIEFLTEEFVNELNMNGVVIPAKCKNYVNECLQAHKKLQNGHFESVQLKENNLKIELSDECSNIKLESINGLLTDDALKELMKKNIVTVGDLLKMPENEEYYNLLLNKKTTTYMEIRGVIRLLKCKYMDIDPMIDFESDADLYELSKEFGLSRRSANCLVRSGYTTKEFLELMHDEARETKLSRIRNAGSVVAQEILTKGSIVIDFYDKKKEKLKNATEDETIEMLYKQLEQTRNEIQILNTRTDEILAKIQEKELEKKKGGVSK